MARVPDFQLNLADLITRLYQAELDWDAENIADCLWLASYIDEATVDTTSAVDGLAVNGLAVNGLAVDGLAVDGLASDPVQIDPPAPGESESLAEPDADRFPPKSPFPSQPVVSLESPTPPAQTISTPEPSPTDGLLFPTPTVPALRKTLSLGRALRPLMRKVDSYTRTELDEAATAEQTAERKFCLTVVRPAQERWLEVALVIEDSPSNFLWQETLRDFKQVLERQGAFRTITVWRLKTASPSEIQLFTGVPNHLPQKPRSPKELVDVSGRRLILFASDCISAAWRTGQLHQDCFTLWANHGPLAIVQLLPEGLWRRTALNASLTVQLGALTPGAPNHKLLFQEIPIGAEADLSQGLKLPVITLEPSSLKRWARMIAGYGKSWATGVWFDPDWQMALSIPAAASQPLNAAQLVQRFMTTATSELSKRLAGLMALAPVRLPIIYLIQETMLPESTPLQVAEVFMSGLIRRVNPAGVEQLDQAYDFAPGVRDLLIETVPTPTTEAVLDRVSQYIGERIGKNIYSFTALLRLEQTLGNTANVEFVRFATLTRQTLQRMGGDYAALLEAINQPVPSLTASVAEQTRSDSPAFETSELVDAQLIEEEPESNFPHPLQTEEFTVVTLQIQQDAPPSPELEQFEFTAATPQGRFAQHAYKYIEFLPGQLPLEMVVIPSGSFMMGSSDTEYKRYADPNEHPQHKVTIQPFIMGRYPITQAQWRAVAALPQVQRELDPDPSYFKGNNRPVEGVSWNYAVEFCARLSTYASRQYRLPTEAEWEYACRAGTTTLFHFGDEITSELANYGGVYRQGTTPVDYFGIANAFGLSDMHGNVLEWCQDHLHLNYDKAPTDGSAWLTGNEKTIHVRRGGSWDLSWTYCRSAHRFYSIPGYPGDLFFGFRVCCSAP